MQPTRTMEQVLRSRRMIRSYTDAPIDSATLEGLLDLARRAPAAGNTAAIDYLVLDTPESVDQYWSTTMTSAKQSTFRWQGLLRAPALVVVATRPSAYVERYSEPDKARALLGSDLDHWAQPFWWIDAGMVAENILLLAAARGLGASLFGVFDHEAALVDAFDIPADRRLVCTIALGHPADEDERGRSSERERPSISSIIHRGRWTPD